MPEAVNEKSVYTLLEVARSIRKTVSERYRQTYWIRAELNKLNYYKHSGHCFPELLEKQDGKVLAQMRSTIWNENYLRINRKFLDVLKEPLKDGVKILFEAAIVFDPVFGLSLHIHDIDPSYTLGDLEKEKQETIKKLRDEALFSKNKMLPLSLLPQRIAIISVSSSKGYSDFLKIIESNSRGYRFFHLLFPSLLQGEKAVSSMIGQLKKIYQVRTHFDAVAIIRGGGDDVGLSCYNHYLLASEIARFPLPVFTGIGHSTNETVSEMVSFYNAITPTKLAEHLIQIFRDFDEPVQRAQEMIVDRSVRYIGEQKKKFQSEVKLFRSVTSKLSQQNRNGLNRQVQLLSSQSLNRFRTEEQHRIRFHQRILLSSRSYLKNLNAGLENIKRNIENMSPENVLKRGYSITLLNGLSVKNAGEVKHGDRLETLILNGQISSVVQSSKNSNPDE